MAEDIDDFGYPNVRQVSSNLILDPLTSNPIRGRRGGQNDDLVPSRIDGRIAIAGGIGKSPGGDIVGVELASYTNRRVLAVAVSQPRRIEIALLENRDEKIRIGYRLHLNAYKPQIIVELGRILGLRSGRQVSILDHQRRSRRRQARSAIGLAGGSGVGAGCPRPPSRRLKPGYACWLSWHQPRHSNSHRLIFNVDLGS